MEPDVPEGVVPVAEPEANSGKMWAGLIVGVIVGLVGGYGIGHVMIGGKLKGAKGELRSQKKQVDNLREARKEDDVKAKKQQEANYRFIDYIITGDVEAAKKQQEADKMLVEKVTTLGAKLANEIKEAQDVAATAQQKAAELETQNFKLAASVQLRGQQDEELQAAKASFEAFRKETLELIEESTNTSIAEYALAWKKKVPLFVLRLQSRQRSLLAKLNKTKIAVRRERNLRKRQIAQMKVKEYEDAIKVLKADIKKIEQGRKQVDHVIATLNPMVLEKIRRPRGKIIVPGR